VLQSTGFPSGLLTIVVYDPASTFRSMRLTPLWRSLAVPVKVIMGWFRILAPSGGAVISKLGGVLSIVVTVTAAEVI
jgi:hypothetical protein